MDELSAFNGAPLAIKDYEAELLERADLMFTGGPSLYEAKRDSHPNVYLFPSSIDLEHFGKARRLAAKSSEEPVDQAVIPHPRLGFFGVIDERMDLGLLEALADTRPDWHLVLIGPIAKLELNRLPRRPNIHYLGKKDYKELPAYLAGWEVALLPFAQNNATRFISPTKTPEYLAGGRPVVSTPIRDVVRPYGELGLVWIADTAAQFVQAVETALALNGNKTQWLERVDEFLATNSWDQTYKQMKDLIDATRAGDGEIVPVNVSAMQPPSIDETVSLPALSVSQVSINGLPMVANRADRSVFDYLIVGAGYSGSVLAERLARGSGKKVLLIDRRLHIAGNAYDHYDEHGLLVHKYGPHIFHTNSREVFTYLSQFTRWRPYEHRVRASVDGMLVPMPINLDTINQLYGLNLTSFEIEKFFESIAEPREVIRTSEDVVVSKIGRQLYEKFFRNYTRKQWDLDPSELDSSVTSRVPIRLNRDDRYFTDVYQAMPLHGYTRMFENLLDHPNIKIMLNTDYKDVVDMFSYRELIYTGPIDEYFDFCFGKLPYRSIQFKFETLQKEFHQPVAVINYPNEHPYTRVTEFKHLTGQEHFKTSLVYEYPCSEGDPYYPIPRPENAEIYKKYKALAEAVPGVHFAGRLGTYKYYNMDQVVAQALTLYAKISGVRRSDLLTTYTSNQFTIEMPCPLFTLDD
jgi:UDP-galactopyranose mutase